MPLVWVMVPNESFAFCSWHRHVLRSTNARVLALAFIGTWLAPYVFSVPLSLLVRYCLGIQTPYRSLFSEKEIYVPSRKSAVLVLWSIARLSLRRDTLKQGAPTNRQSYFSHSLIDPALYHDALDHNEPCTKFLSSSPPVVTCSAWPTTRVLTNTTQRYVVNQPAKHWCWEKPPNGNLLSMVFSTASSPLVSSTRRIARLPE